MSDLNLRIPGPVPLPEEVLEITGRQMINHRGPEFAEIIDRMT
ncbi:MAG: alanine--glyoxylate aminotransferase family protein, partial [Chloroflexi bacterium]|nr:alanine--glyoxylate aminotransferase family protein [Chloroflexota bacterium]